MLKRKGRHRAPASPRSTGTVLVPAVLLAAGGGAFAGLVSTPASAGSGPVRAAAAAEVTPLTAADLRGVAGAAAGTGAGTGEAQDSAAKRAAQARAERAIAAARASRARRAAPPPPPPSAPPATPVEGGTVQDDAHEDHGEDDREDHDEADEQEARQDESPRVVRPSGGGLTSRYGRRWGRMHKGVDFGAAYGSPIRAVRGGTVVSAGYDSSGYGNLVLVRHDDGVVTAYAHMSKILVRGGWVSAGEVIGRIGSTGHSTGPHLHFEVRRGGRAVNPLPWLRAHGIDV